MNDLSCLGTDIKRIDSRKREKEWNRATSDKVTKVRHVRSDSDSVLPYTFHCYGKSTSGMMCDVSNKSIFIPKHSRYSYANVPKKQDTVRQVKVKPSSHCVTLSMEKPEITHSEWVISQFLLASSPAWNFKRNPVSLPFIPRYSETYLDRDTLASQNTHLIGEKEDYSQYAPGHLHVLSSARDYSQYLTSSVPPQRTTGGDRRDLNTLIWLPPLGIEKEMEGAEPGEIVAMNPFSSALVAPTETNSSSSASAPPANPPSLKSEQFVDSDVWHNDMYLSYLDEPDPYSMIPSRVRSHRSHRKHQRHHKSTLSETKESTESTSQSDLEEEAANLKKLREVSHRWRKRERWLESLPSEEGEVPLSEMKISFFKREGIDIKSIRILLVTNRSVQGGSAVSGDTGATSSRKMERSSRKNAYGELHHFSQGADPPGPAQFCFSDAEGERGGEGSSEGERGGKGSSEGGRAAAADARAAAAATTSAHSLPAGA